MTTASWIGASALTWSQAPAPDYRLEIAEVEWELSRRKKIRTAAYNGQIPGPLLRIDEGKPVTIEISNRVQWPEIVHWHGQWNPVAADGSMEEGSPPISAGTTSRVLFTPRPSGLHWYHTHGMAGHSLKRGLYTGQAGVLYVQPKQDAGSYDAEHFLVLQDWDPYYSGSDDGSLMVHYTMASINGRMSGYGDPIRVREGQRVLFHIVNASATETHWIALPNHRFKVIALDGAPVPTQGEVDVLRMGPAERISAVATMNSPGVYLLGEARHSFRSAGMGIVLEYAERHGQPTESVGQQLSWSYSWFADAEPRKYAPDVTIPLVFTSRFKGRGAVDQWMINGKSWPNAAPLRLQEGKRHRLVFQNKSMDDHPVHLHRHHFEIVMLHGNSLSGVSKDVIIVEAGTTIEADLVAANPGNTLFHCHQQDHMDAGFMAMFRYE